MIGLNAGTCSVRIPLNPNPDDVILDSNGFFIGYTSDSLSYAVSDSVDSRISGKDATTTKPIFSVRDNATPSYIRNTSCWLGAVRIDCVSVWTSSTGNLFCPTAIAPDCVIGAAHAFPSVGSTIRFVTMDNQIIERTITAALTHPDYTPYMPDLRVGKLSSALPESFVYPSVLPANFRIYAPSLNTTRAMAALKLDQESKALTSDLGQITLNSRAIFQRAYGVNKDKRNEFYEDSIGGDSGAPCFLILSGNLVLLTLLTEGGWGAGTFVSDFIPAINEMMAQLDSTHTLTQSNLTPFTTY